MTYKPTVGDLAFRDAALGGGDLNPFDKAELLRGVSDTYLVVLASDNAGPTSAGTKVFFDAEITRRGSLVARRANTIATWALAVSGASFLAAVLAIVLSFRK